LHGYCLGNAKAWASARRAACPRSFFLRSPLRRPAAPSPLSTRYPSPVTAAVVPSLRHCSIRISLVV
jgi:hypothetical protein